MRVQSIAATVLLLALAGSGCGHDKTKVVTQTVTITGADVVDFTSLSRYLDDPAVQRIFSEMPRNQGSTPPQVDGTFSYTGTVIASNTPNNANGSGDALTFCLGIHRGAALEVAITSPAYQSGGAFSFIEGSGNLFTVYAALKLIETGPGGLTCEEHWLIIFSGTRNGDGSLSNLTVGSAIVGLVGDCTGLQVDDTFVSQGSAARTATSCVGDFTPSDETKVLLDVNNFLAVDVLVNVSGFAATVVPALSTLSYEPSPGFTVSFTSIQPRNESNAPLGTTLSQTFAQDVTPAGRYIAYGITNVTTDNSGNGTTYFAPIVQNQLGAGSSNDLKAIVNGTDCSCTISFSKASQYVLGYYLYGPSASIHVLRASGGADLDSVAFPFLLLPDSGTITFDMAP